jgi:hypothetical protein
MIKINLYVAACTLKERKERDREKEMKVGI